MSTCKYTGSVEKWGTFEAEMSGRHEGNPFTDYTIQGTFKGKEETKTVDGFYDGDGVYKEYYRRFVTILSFDLIATERLPSSYY